MAIAEIPIQNIYYMLCYAWDKLEARDIVDVNEIGSNKLLDLFARVLSNGCSKLLKQGLDRYYAETESILIGVKGKLHLSQTIKHNILHHCKTYCGYDEFDCDILNNQILKSTISKLLRTKDLDGKIREDLRNIYLKFPPVTEIKINKSLFNQIKIHRNNFYYDFLLKVCRLIHERLMIEEKEGRYEFIDFFRDEKAMASLFEEFVRNFYRIESDYDVSSKNITWAFEAFENKEDLEMLPEMRTDITLQKDGRKIIIDTKFYREALSTHFDKEKIKSEHLYQIFSYLINQEEANREETLNCEGILLYPTNRVHFKYSYKYGTHRIRVMTIDLNREWRQIHDDLLAIVEE